MEKIKEDSMSVSLDSHKHKCPVCKKEFECPVQTIYKFQIYDRDNDCKTYEYFCGYNCYRVRQRQKESKRRIRVADFL